MIGKGSLDNVASIRHASWTKPRRKTRGSKVAGLTAGDQPLSKGEKVEVGRIAVLEEVKNIELERQSRIWSSWCSERKTGGHRVIHECRFARGPSLTLAFWKIIIITLFHQGATWKEIKNSPSTMDKHAPIPAKPKRPLPLPIIVKSGQGNPAPTNIGESSGKRDKDCLRIRQWFCINVHTSLA